MKFKFSISLFCIFFTQFSFSNNRPLKFCYEDQDSYPWVLKDGTGLNLSLMKILAVKLNTEIILTSVPWKRCLEDLKKGDVFDGAFAASYKEDRLEFGRYPTLNGLKEGKPNENKRLHRNEYSLYVLKDEKTIRWDGNIIYGVDVVGSLPGYSINDFLKKLNIRVDDGTRMPLGVFEKLISKRYRAIAMQDYRADYVLKQKSELNNQIKKILPPLEKKSYYLMLSAKMFEKEKDYSNLIWDKIEEIRNSKEYKNMFEEFFKSKN